ncbi:MAG: N-acetyltransferase family protein [Microbacterium sp.]
MTDLTERTALRVSRIIVPESLSAPDAGPFLEMVRIANDACLVDAGHDYLHEQAEEVFGFWQDQTDWTQIGFAAVRDGRMLGTAKILISTEDDVSSLEFDLFIDPDHRGEGAEGMLLEAVESEARDRGIHTIQTWTLHRPDTPGPMVAPPTGFGSIPANDRQTVFMHESGFGLEQVERNSVLDLRGPTDVLEQKLAEAQAVAGPDYRLLMWTSPTPAEHLDGFAYAISRMATDAPAGGLVVEEQHWDAARVRRRDARLKAQGLTVSVACVQHVPTGIIAGYNELVIAADHSGATQQYGTLVLSDHRGRRLGTIVKCANLLRWRALVPESPRVSTFNAEENRHMLDINEAIGFVPASYAGAWKKVLD